MTVSKELFGDPCEGTSKVSKRCEITCLKRPQIRLHSIQFNSIGFDCIAFDCRQTYKDSSQPKLTINLVAFFSHLPISNQLAPFESKSQILNPSTGATSFTNSPSPIININNNINNNHKPQQHNQTTNTLACPNLKLRNSKSLWFASKPDFRSRLQCFPMAAQTWQPTNRTI